MYKQWYEECKTNETFVKRFGTGAAEVDPGTIKDEPHKVLFSEDG